MATNNPLGAAQAAPELQYYDFEIAYRVELEREYMRQQFEAKEASRIADELLLMCLDADQQLRWKVDKSFLVRANSGNLYQLSLDYPPLRIDDGYYTISYCIHTIGVPRENELLGFKLLIETDEYRFLEIANAMRLAFPRPVRTPSANQRTI